MEDICDGTCLKPHTQPRSRAYGEGGNIPPTCVWLCVRCMICRMKKPMKRSKKAPRSTRKGRFTVNFGVAFKHRKPPEFDGLRIKGGPGSIDLPRKLALAKRIALMGLDDEQMARIAGVSIETYDYWKALHGDLDKAIEDGKSAADAEVVASLYKLATGFEQEVEEVAGKDADVVRYNKYHPPELGAIKHWLNSRVPGFREVQRTDVTSKGKPLMPKESKAELIASIVSAVRPRPDGEKPKSKK